MGAVVLKRDLFSDGVVDLPWTLVQGKPVFKNDHSRRRLARIFEGRKSVIFWSKRPFLWKGLGHFGQKWPIFANLSCAKQFLCEIFSLMGPEKSWE